MKKKVIAVVSSLFLTCTQNVMAFAEPQEASTVEKSVTQNIEAREDNLTKNYIEAIEASTNAAETKAAMEALEKIRAEIVTEGIKNKISAAMESGNAKVKSFTAAELVSYAKEFLGTPYVWGGTTPSGFDCSGFTQYVFKHFGYSIGRTTYDQIKDGKSVERSDLQPGDLIFTSAGHVGIYVGDNQFIHSPKTGDVIKISTLTKFYGARRILQ